MDACRARTASLIFGVALVAACSAPPARRAAGVRPEPSAPPPAHVEPDASVAIEPAEIADAATSPAPREARPPFAPQDVGAITPSAAAARADDGRWTPVSLPNEGDEGAVLYRTLLHPDATRAADLYVVAIDLGRVGLRAVAGVSEPVATTAAGKRAPRPALIPAEDRPALLAAFNGGWRSEHGHYGMKVDGVLLVPPSEASCTVAGYDDEMLRIGPWKALAADEPRLRFLRQTPPCLWTGGTRHPALAAEMTTSWGASEQGDPLIRRSALGLNQDRTILFFGLGNTLTARALADGMHHAGAVDVAELDVNWSYPKLLVFRPNGAGALEASSLFPGFVFEKGEYVRRRADRDFFYLIRR